MRGAAVNLISCSGMETFAGSGDRPVASASHQPWIINYCAINHRFVQSFSIDYHNAVLPQQGPVPLCGHCISAATSRD